MLATLFIFPEIRDHGIKVLDEVAILSPLRSPVRSGVTVLLVLSFPMTQIREFSPSLYSSKLLFQRKVLIAPNQHISPHTW